MVNSRRIVKNSLWLYLRMLLVTGVALYTSRVVLKALGVEDFGIYNVTGSLVAFLSVLTTTMSNSTQRFLNIKKGENDYEAMSMLLGASINIHKIASCAIFILAETFGLYFVLEVLVISDDKILDAFWCYQSSILALIFTFFRIPYMSLAVTYEKFAFIAWTSLIDVTIKLLMAFALNYLEYHRLIFYGFSFSLMAILQFVVFKLYCSKILAPTTLKLNDTFKFRESKSLLSFSSWNILGNISNVMANQGIGIILNVFYSVVVNAALGITNQVTNTIATFVNNVQQAFRPQLLQAYADSDKSSFLSLLYSTSRWSFYLMMLISVPLICNIKYILNLWLGDYPEYSDSFIVILIGYLLIDSLGTPLLNGIEASGRIRRFQIVLTLLYILNVLMAWIVCFIQLSPNIAIITKLITNFLILAVKCKELRRIDTSFQIGDYVSSVVLRIFPLFCLCLLFIYLNGFFQDSMCKLLTSTIVFFLLYSILLFVFGLTKAERHFCISKIR